MTSVAANAYIPRGLDFSNALLLETSIDFAAYVVYASDGKPLRFLTIDKFTTHLNEFLRLQRERNRLPYELEVAVMQTIESENVDWKGIVEGFNFDALIEGYAGPEGAEPSEADEKKIVKAFTSVLGGKIKAWVERKTQQEKFQKSAEATSIDVFRKLGNRSELDWSLFTSGFHRLFNTDLADLVSIESELRTMLANSKELGIDRGTVFRRRDDQGNEIIREEKKRPGRQPGSGKGRKAAASTDLDGLANKLVAFLKKSPNAGKTAIVGYLNIDNGEWGKLQRHALDSKLIKKTGEKRSTVYNAK